MLHRHLCHVRIIRFPNHPCSYIYPDSSVSSTLIQTYTCSSRYSHAHPDTATLIQSHTHPNAPINPDDATLINTHQDVPTLIEMHPHETTLI